MPTFVYFRFRNLQANSAPSTPSGKEGDPKTFLSKDVTHKSTNRRHSGVKTTTVAAATPATPASAEILPFVPTEAAVSAKDRLLTQSRSRLAQELLEQNYAILQKLKKDRSQSFDAPASEEADSVDHHREIAAQQGKSTTAPSQTVQANPLPGDAAVKNDARLSIQKY